MDLSKITGMLKQARDAGATAAQMAEIRHFFKTTADWHPTKKRATVEQRRTRRKMQRQSRRTMRGTFKGVSNRKGKRFTKSKT